MYSCEKVIIAGDTLHHFKYSRPIQYDFTKTTQKQCATGEEEETHEKREKGFDTNGYKVRKRVKLLLQANAYQYRNNSFVPFRPIFITYTFKSNVTELREANAHFGKFTKRLNYQIFGTKSARLKFLVVPEFQKRGAVHYHAIYFNLPYVEKIYDFINKTWGHGFTNIQTINDITHLTNYVGKYFTKTDRDEKTFSQKKYFCSRGLNQPREYREERLCAEILSQLKSPNFRQQYEKNELKTTYSCYHEIPQFIKEFSLLESSYYKLGSGSSPQVQKPVVYA